MYLYIVYVCVVCVCVCVCVTCCANIIVNLRLCKVLDGVRNGTEINAGQRAIFISLLQLLLTAGLEVLCVCVLHLAYILNSGVSVLCLGMCMCICVYDVHVCVYVFVVRPKRCDHWCVFITLVLLGSKSCSCVKVRKNAIHSLWNIP